MKNNREFDLEKIFQGELEVEATDYRAPKVPWDDLEIYEIEVDDSGLPLVIGDYVFFKLRHDIKGDVSDLLFEGQISDIQRNYNNTLILSFDKVYYR